MLCKDKKNRYKKTPSIITLVPLATSKDCKEVVLTLLLISPSPPNKEHWSGPCKMFIYNFKTEMKQVLTVILQMLLSHNKYMSKSGVVCETAPHLMGAQSIYNEV